MDLTKIKLTVNDMVLCESLLPSWQKLIKMLNDEKVFSMGTIPLLIKYEMGNKRRKNVIDRLLARYYKLSRKHTYNKLCRIIDFRDSHEGKGN